MSRQAGESLPAFLDLTREALGEEKGNAKLYQRTRNLRHI